MQKINTWSLDIARSILRGPVYSVALLVASQTLLAAEVTSTITTESSNQSSSSSLSALAPAEGSISSSFRLPTFRHFHHRESVSLITSVSEQKTDSKTVKSSGSDDAGQVNESSSLPNLSYLSARLQTSWADGNRANLGVLQSLNTPDQRLVHGATKTYTIPGEVFGLGFEHDYTETVYFGLRDSYIDTSGFNDPSVGVTYHRDVTEGFSPRATAALFAPTTQRSQAQNTLTKGLLRYSETYRSHRWATYGGVSIARVFFAGNDVNADRSAKLCKLQNGGDDSKCSSTGSFAQSASGQTAHASVGYSGRSGHGSGTQHDGSTGFGGPTPTLSHPSEIDLIFLDHEVQRVGMSVSETYHASDDLKVSASASVSRLETTKGADVWFSSARVFDVAYTVSKWTTSTSLTYYSDFTHYQDPQIPSQWMISMRLTRNFGDDSSVVR